MASEKTAVTAVGSESGLNLYILGGDGILTPIEGKVVQSSTVDELYKLQKKLENFGYRVGLMENGFPIAVGTIGQSVPARQAR